MRVTQAKACQRSRLENSLKLPLPSSGTLPRFILFNKEGDHEAASLRTRLCTKAAGDTYGAGNAEEERPKLRHFWKSFINTTVPYLPRCQSQTSRLHSLSLSFSCFSPSLFLPCFHCITILSFVHSFYPLLSSPVLISLVFLLPSNFPLHHIFLIIPLLPYNSSLLDTPYLPTNYTFPYFTRRIFVLLCYCFFSSPPLFHFP